MPKQGFCRVLGACAQCENCVKWGAASASKRKSLPCHRTTRRRGCCCPVCLSCWPAAVDQPEEDSQLRKLRRKSTKQPHKTKVGEYSEAGQVVNASRFVENRKRKERKKRSDLDHNQSKPTKQATFNTHKGSALQKQKGFICGGYCGVKSLLLCVALCPSVSL